MNRKISFYFRLLAFFFCLFKILHSCSSCVFPILCPSAINCVHLWVINMEPMRGYLGTECRGRVDAQETRWDLSSPCATGWCASTLAFPLCPKTAEGNKGSLFVTGHDMSRGQAQWVRILWSSLSGSQLRFFHCSFGFHSIILPASNTVYYLLKL